MVESERSTSVFLDFNLYLSLPKSKVFLWEIFSFPDWSHQQGDITLPTWPFQADEDRRQDGSGAQFSFWTPMCISSWVTALLFLVQLMRCPRSLKKSNLDEDWISSNSVVWVNCNTKYLLKTYFSSSVLCLYTCAPWSFRYLITENVYVKSCCIFLPPSLHYCIYFILFGAANRCTSITKRHCSFSFGRKCCHWQLRDIHIEIAHFLKQTSSKLIYCCIYS